MQINVCFYYEAVNKKRTDTKMIERINDSDALMRIIDTRSDNKITVKISLYQKKQRYDVYLMHKYHVYIYIYIYIYIYNYIDINIAR